MIATSHGSVLHTASTVDGSRHAEWYFDHTVIIRNRAWQEVQRTVAVDKPAFDAICVEQGITPVQTALKRR
jgi:hypothetical protein